MSRGVYVSVNCRAARREGCRACLGAAQISGGVFAEQGEFLFADYFNTD